MATGITRFEESVRGDASTLAGSIFALGVRPLQLLLAAPALLFLLTLTLIQFRPPNLGLCPCDRVAFLLLVFAVISAALLQRKKLPFVFSISVPALGLLMLALARAWTQEFDAETWSLVAAKFIVPFVLFHLAALVFTSESSVRQLEIFCMVTLGYLCFVSIAFLVGATELIFPRFILDAGVEMHSDRARGPFLQAVANGVTLNLLGLIVFDLYRRKRIRVAVAAPLLLSLPVAIFATLTRAVWLSFVLSMMVLALAAGGRLRRAVVWLALGAITTVGATLANSGLGMAFQERFADRDPVEFRLAVYRLSWDMVREKPLLGWGQGEFAREIEARISDFRPGTYAAHNTFIEILVEHGGIGIGLYAWMMIGLFRLGKKSRWLHFTWPVLLGVYFLNACFVVMNYQFVNALVFTFAGVLAGQAADGRRSSP